MDAQCPNWPLVRKAYLDATRKRVVWHTIQSASVFEQVAFALVSTLFFSLLIAWLVMETWPWLVGMFLAELVVLGLYFHMSDRFLTQVFAYSQTRASPVGRKDHQLPRYLSFRRDLRSAKVSKKEAGACIELVDQLMVLNKTGRAPYQLLVGYVMSIVVGALSTWAPKANWSSLIIVGYAATLTIIVITMWLSVVPSQRQQLEEWKLFLMMYSKGVRVS